jgi:uncharacterized repeat protein (TIGR01451 family)
MVTLTQPLARFPVLLSASIDDSQNGGGAISKAEYYIDNPPWAGGTAIPLEPSDGLFDQPTEQVIATLSTTGWDMGQHTLFVRGQDGDGFWGPVSAVFFSLNARSGIQGHVEDQDYGLPIGDANLVIENVFHRYETVTDFSGDYQKSIFSGEYSVTASAYGYITETVGGIEIPQNMTATLDFSLSTLPSGTLTGYVYELGTNLPLAGAEIKVHGLENTAPTDNDGFYSMVLPSGIYSITARAKGHYSQTQEHVVIPHTRQVDFWLPLQPCLLLVDDDYGGLSSTDYVSYYQEALVSAGLQYNLWTIRTDGVPSVQDLRDYNALLWFTGDRKHGTLTLGEQTVLRSYMSDGGGLFLSGQNIAADIAIDIGSFLDQNLGASFALENAEPSAVLGTGIFSGQMISFDGDSGANNQVSPDVIRPENGAAEVFNYSNGETAGVVFETADWRSIYLAFGVEGVDGVDNRRLILQDGFEWLGCSPAAVDLQIDKTVSSTSIRSGESLTYTITLRNHSAVPLTGLVFTDTLSQELDFISAQPTAVFDGGVVYWVDLSVPPESSLKLTLVTHVAEGVIAGTVIRNSDYGARLSFSPTPILGNQQIETTVLGEPYLKHQVFLPGVW